MMTYIEKMRAEFDDGSPIAIHEVALFCIWNNEPLPDWAKADVERIIRSDMDERPNRGRGIVVPAAAAYRWERDRGLYDTIQHLIGLPAWVAGLPGDGEIGLQDALDYLASLQNKPGNPVTAAGLRQAYYRERDRRQGVKSAE